MQFKDVVGQEKAKQQLIKSVLENRLSHAHLFLGSEGTGSLPLAWAFAQYLVCENRNSSDSCGTCSSCQKAGKVIHPDLHFIFPTISGEKSAQSSEYMGEWREFILKSSYSNVFEWLKFLQADKKQGNISAVECRQITGKLSMKAFEGGYKIMLLWMAEYLGNQGNILLKLIEEPPDHTVIILVAEDQDKLLNTIISRTQITKTAHLDSDELAEALISRHGLNKDEALSIAYLSDGNYNEALKVVEQKENDQSEAFRDWMRLCLRSDHVALIPFIEQVSKSGRENQKNFLQYALMVIRETLHFKLISGYRIKLPEAEMKLISFLAENYGVPQLEKSAEALNSSIYYVERNANAKILFLDMSIRFIRILKEKNKELV